MKFSNVNIIIVNHLLQRLYYKHIYNTITEKIFNILVYATVFFIIVYVTMYFFPISSVLSYMKPLVPLVYIILGLELLKEAAIARNYTYFFHKHWIDLSVLTLLSSSILFIGYVGLVKFPFFEPLKLALEETKHYRAVKSMFDKE